jgi:hypothetical protein
MNIREMLPKFLILFLVLHKYQSEQQQVISEFCRNHEIVVVLGFASKEPLVDSHLALFTLCDLSVNTKVVIGLVIEDLQEKVQVLLL